MIDLHMHTEHSDGTDSVIELLKKAEESGIEIISITDHDDVEAYIELKNIDIKKYFSGRLVTGSELRSIYKGKGIEILGYGIDIDKIKNSKYVVKQAGDKRQAIYLEDMKKIGREIGLRFNENIYIGETNIFASSTFAKEIFRYEENKPIIEKYNLGLCWDEFYRTAQTNPKSIFYIDETEEVSPPEAIINEIHEAGGLAFLAHPFMYFFENELETFEDFIKEYDIDGLECYYPLFNDEQTDQLLELCAKYNKYVSGGSDYHGENKPDIKMAIGIGNLEISHDIVKDWIDIIK